MRSQHIAVFLAILCVSSGGLVGVGAATSDTRPSESPPDVRGPSEPAIQTHLAEITAERVPNTSKVKFTATFDIPHSYSNPAVYLPDTATVVSMSGFGEAEDAGNVDKYSVTTTYSPKIAFTVNISNQVKSELGTGETWAVGRVPSMTFQWNRNDNREQMELLQNPDSEPRVSHTAENGILGRYLMVFGDYETHTKTGDAHTFIVVTPDTIQHPPNETRVLKSLTRFDNRTEFSGRDSVYLFITPEQQYGGFAYFGGEAVVGYRERVSGPRNTFIHEYVHTQQQFTPTKRTQWVTEGFAEYFSVKATYQQGASDKIETTWALTRNRSGELNDPDTWADDMQYVRGARMFAVIDLAIQQRTESQSGVADVFIAANSAPGKLTQNRLIQIVNQVHGVEQTAKWRHLFNTNSPTINLTGWYEPFDRDNATFDQTERLVVNGTTVSEQDTGTDTGTPTRTPTPTKTATPTKTEAQPEGVSSQMVRALLRLVFSDVAESPFQNAVIDLTNRPELPDRGV